MPTLYEQILTRSLEVDADWNNIEPSEIPGKTFVIPVPKNHERYQKLKTYPVYIRSLLQDDLAADLLIVDQALRNHPVLTGMDTASQRILFWSSEEKMTKDIVCLDRHLEDLKGVRSITAIGGGVILNSAGYIAEHLSSHLVYIPTTPISMSDSAIGGKVRANRIEETGFHKHAYKAFYEPDSVVLDPAFLETFSESQLKSGFAEIVKHALYQSNGLTEYLLSRDFSLSDKQSVIKAIVWTIDLKRICLEVDPEESRDGSYNILRAAHDRSDRLEEESGFMLAHGNAVLRAMWEERKILGPFKTKAEKIYSKLNIELN